MLIGIFGAALLSLVVVDVFWTSLLMAGAGPLSSVIASGMWRAARALPLSHRARNVVGPLILFGLVLVWAALLWLGWFCIFASSGDAVRSTSTKAPATLAETFYFAGYTVFTLGNGEFAPNGLPWNVLTAVAAGSGLVVITLAITYLIGVLSAVAEKRALAATLAGLGATPDAIVCGSWTGSDFTPLQTYFVQISSALDLYVERHLAYPILHYFHGEERRVAMPVRLAALNEAVLLLADGVQPESRLHPLYTEPLRRSLRSLAAVAGDDFVPVPPQAPAILDLHVIASAGIPVVSQEQFERSVSQEAETRRVLLGLVEHDTWEWGDVWADPNG